MEECINKVIYKASVSNGWNEEFETVCGSFGDGIKRYCKSCASLLTDNKIKG